MACNSCAKPFTLFRKDKGCPGCGFSYCSKCLEHKVFLPKINAEAKVCLKCKSASAMDNKKKIDPPDAYFKRIGATSNDSNSTINSEPVNDVESEIKQRLQLLKEERNATSKSTTDEDILKRLKNIKGDQPTTSDTELQARLANLKGIPVIAGQNKAVLIAPDLRTEQEQADDLMKQYLEHAHMDKQYKEGFDKQLEDIEARIKKLRGNATATTSYTNTKEADVFPDSEDEDTIIKKIIKRAKVESTLQDDDIPTSSNDELPFCEICNEDAKMRCLGCRYLFCKQCFKEHKDDDDGCNKYEPYTPPKSS